MKSFISVKISVLRRMSHHQLSEGRDDDKRWNTSRSLISLFIEFQKVKFMLGMVWFRDVTIACHIFSEKATSRQTKRAREEIAPIRLSQYVMKTDVQIFATTVNIQVDNRAALYFSVSQSNAKLVVNSIMNTVTSKSN